MNTDIRPDLLDRRRERRFQGDRCGRRRLGTGVFLILLGLLLALDQWHQLPFHAFSHHWPLILVAFGVGRMVDRGFFAPGPHAAILAGLWFELETLGHPDWARHIWPVGLIWIGFILLLRGLRAPAPSLPGAPDGDGRR